MVTHTPAVLNDDVADLAIALMLAWSRQIARADRFVRAGAWAQGPLPLGRKMSGARAWASSAWGASARRSRSAPRPSA